MRILRSSLCFTAFLLIPGTTIVGGPNGRGPFDLVERVRQATARFQNVQVAVAEGYEGGACVSGRDRGAMGIHYVKGSLLGDGMLDPDAPEALIYEPTPGGQLRLVGVEYITLAEVWHTVNGEGVPPVLEGHLFHYTGSPNRYAIPPFYELHVWAWRENPNGTFADWNPLVRCDALAAG